jgi:hypothetical protein
MLSLKNNVPMANVKMGVSELRIPAKELSILVCAMEKRKAGKNDPSKPEMMTDFIIGLGTALSALGKSGNITNPVKSILREAT